MSRLYCHVNDKLGGNCTTCLMAQTEGDPCHDIMLMMKKGSELFAEKKESC
jgi:hypothetical protein